MMLLPGHSGCKVEVIKTPDTLVVRKSSDDAHYIARLEKQCKKQIEYARYFDSDRISVPAVINFNAAGSKYSFDMNFIPGMDVISYLEYASKEKIDMFIHSIMQIIETLLDDCCVSNVTTKIHAKYTAVKNDVKPRWSLTTKEEDVLDQKILKGDIFLPSGKCHGDLTFSNILIDRDSNRIHLIDFLDSFIETPLQDMAKIRQDTRFGWSLRLYTGTCDAVRMRTIFAYMDGVFHNEFRRFNFYNKYYEMMQMINVLRVMNYSFDKRTYSYLEKCLKGLLNDKT